MKITRSQMIEAARKNIEFRQEYAKKWIKSRNSFAAWGSQTRIRTAELLLKRLEAGKTPTTREVVGYFGKGARFSE